MNRPAARPRLGVLDFNPIQYHAPLYQRLADRGRVELDVLYLQDGGYRPAVDPGFGVPVAWNIDLLSGYGHRFLASTAPRTARTADRARRLAGWIRSCDAVVIHGHSNQWMLLAAGLARAQHVPYLLRGDSGPHGRFAGWRGLVRDGLARMMVSHSSGGLAVGQLNDASYRKYGAPHVTFAPHSVDNERFARPPRLGRRELLARWNLDSQRPVIMFCGKLRPGKRPLDLLQAVERLPEVVSTVFVGDGVLADEIRARLRKGCAAVTGFVNQAELPAFYHAADILVLPSRTEPWGLVVNEAMAAGVFPVVSDHVGATPDLVQGVGEVYPCGDIPALTAAVTHALVQIKDPGVRRRMRQHVARYSIDATADGFEKAALAVSSGL
jgi:glycosyltransferase involved in cell wall biosynthesis